MPSKRKKYEVGKAKKKRGRKRENLKLLLSANAETSQTNILHLDQKAAKCVTCKWLYGRF